MSKVEIIEKDGKKYIDKEEVLCSYQCTSEFFVVVRMIFFCVFIYVITKNFQNYSIFEKIGGSLFVFGLCYFIFLEINNLFHRGFYITQNHLITFSGKKIPVENVMYRSISAKGHVIIQFYDNKKFIQFCFVNNNDLFKIFIKHLNYLSNNSDFTYDSSTNSFGFYNKNIKRKLINTKGVEDGRAN